MQKSIIVVPCYNEEKRLDLVGFRDFLEQSPSTLLFVNDGSNDGTLKVLSNFQIELGKERLLVLNLPRVQSKQV